MTRSLPPSRNPPIPPSWGVIHRPRCTSSTRPDSGYSGGTASKHTSLSPSHPTPPSPSPATSRSQSGAPSIHSRHRSASGLSIASTSSSFKFGTLKSTLPLLQFTRNGPPQLCIVHLSSVYRSAQGIRRTHQVLGCTLVALRELMCSLALCAT